MRGFCGAMILRGDPEWMRVRYAKPTLGVTCGSGPWLSQWVRPRVGCEAGPDKAHAWPVQHLKFARHSNKARDSREQ